MTDALNRYSGLGANSMASIETHCERIAIWSIGLVKLADILESTGNDFLYESIYEVLGAVAIAP
jgi:hypothetical protein